MKSYHFYIFSIFLIFGCTDFKEDINTPFLSSKEVHTSDFDTSFPVINLDVDINEFNKMYENPSEEIEIEGDFNLYRNNELLIDAKKVDIEIKGGISATFSLKSLGIKFDKTFKNTNNELLNPVTILPKHSLSKIKAVRLRNSGNDFKGTMLKDISYTQMAINAGLDLELMYFEPAIVFVNNSFLGLMNLRSEANRNGMYRLNDVDKDDITLAKINTPGELEKKNGDFERIDKLIAAIDAENTTYLKKEIDLSNFIDYVIYQTYIANVDWPFNNVRFYAVKDNPFRFVLFDLDMVNLQNMKVHPLKFIKEPSEFGGSFGSAYGAGGVENPITDLFNVLYSDSDFKNMFTKRYLELINSNAFSSDKFNEIIDENFNKISPYMPIHLDKYSEIHSMIEWYLNLDLLKQDFKNREENLKSISPLF